MNPRQLGTLLALALLLLPGAAWSQNQAGQGLPWAQWWQNPRISRELGLSNFEKRRLSQMHLSMRQGLITQRGHLQQARLGIEAQFDQEPLDRTAIDSELNRLAQAQTEMTLIKSRFLVHTRELLGLKRFRVLKQIFARAKARRSNRP